MDVPDSIIAPKAEPASPPVSFTGPARQASLPDKVLAFADRHRHKLFAALLVIYLLGFNAQWRLEPDSALYLAVGRNLAEGHGYTYQGQRHHLAFPGPPLLFAGTFKLFHTEHLVPALVLMLLIGFAALGLTYRLFLLHAGRPTAVLITFGLGISRLFYRYCFELLSDLPFLLGVMAFLVGYEAVFHRRRPGARVEGEPVGTARWFDWALLVVGLAVAVAMRPAMWALLLAIILALGWSIIRGPVRWPQVVTCVVVIALGVLFWKFDPRHSGSHEMGQYEDALFEVTFSHLGVMLHQMFFEYIPRLFEGTLSQALFGCRLGPGLNTLAGIAVLLVSATMLRHRPLWILWVGLTILMMLVAVKPLDRYFLEVLPLLVFAWWRGIRWLNLRLPQPWADWAFVGLLLLGATTNLSRTGEFIVEQRRVPFRNYYKEGRFASTDPVVKMLKGHVDKDGWVLAPPKVARILTFLSRRNVVEPVPATQLDPRNQKVYVLAPLENPVRKWLLRIPAHLGRPISPAVKSKYDPEPWQLYTVEPGP